MNLPLIGVGRVVFPFLLLAAVCAEAGSDMKWVRPDLDSRVVFDIPEEAGMSLLIEVAAGNELAANLSFAARGPGNRPVRHQVVYADEKKAAVVVEVEPGPGKGGYSLYYGSPSHDSPGEPSNDGPLALLPVVLQVHEHKGESVPDTWPKMRYLYLNSGDLVTVSRCHHLGDLESEGEGIIEYIISERLGGRKGRSRRRKAKELRSKRWIARAKFTVVCPVGGAYRFAVDSKDSAFLLVDNQPAASRRGRHEPGSWRSDRVLELEAGPHTVDIYNSWKGGLFLDAGWQVPGSDEITAIPHAAIQPGARPEEWRIEKKDRSIHPAFSFRKEQAYSFCGSGPVFLPVRFRNRTVKWGGGGTEWRWKFSDEKNKEPSEKAWSRSNSVVHVFAEPGLHRAVLEVRGDKGEVEVCSRSVDLRLVEPKIIPLAARLESVPPVCYPEDPVEPVLNLRCGVPDFRGLTVKWEARTVAAARETETGDVGSENGENTTEERDVFFEEGSAYVKPGKWKAGELSALEWSLRHEGRVVLSGRTLFRRTPFSEVPAYAKADALYGSSGERMVLVPGREACGRRNSGPLSLRKQTGRILWVDDSVGFFKNDGDLKQAVDAGMLSVVESRLEADVRYASLRRKSGMEEIYSPLEKLAAVPGMVEPEDDVVVLSVGGEDIAISVSPAAFERYAAALSDLLGGTKGCRVIWATPVARPEEAAGLRPFAAAVLRVADARNIPVADLYSAFLWAAMEQRFPFEVRGRGLSRSGRELAGRIIASAISDMKKDTGSTGR
ncbi:MAG: hypothetical protein R6V03_05140 [Kiritimatiellia bacterium]